IVLLHGWSGSMEYFKENAALQSLGQKGLRVVRYDHRFHGRSDKPDHGMHVARLAADLRDVMQQLDLSDVTLVGTSMGAAVIWSYIELFGSDKISKAVVVDQAPLQNKLDDWSFGSKGCYDEKTLKNLQNELANNFSAFAQGNYDCCVSIPLSEDLKKLVIDETLLCSGPQLGRLMADHTQLDWRSLLPTIEIPFLNCVGGNSGCFPLEGTRRVGELMKSCKTVTFKEANHW
ncbi:hypothetical protein GUITHDRAFT_42624, partial [Guillardia theta CCMP2712]